MSHRIFGGPTMTTRIKVNNSPSFPRSRIVIRDPVTEVCAHISCALHLASYSPKNRLHLEDDGWYSTEGLSFTPVLVGSPGYVVLRVNLRHLLPLRDALPPANQLSGPLDRQFLSRRRA